MAVVAVPPKGSYQWADETVCVTKEARNSLSSENIWFHLGGYSDEGDSFDTQLYEFEKELQEFWDALIGPYESFRSEIVSAIRSNHELYDKWQKVTVFEDGNLEIIFKDGRRQKVNLPAESA